MLTEFYNFIDHTLDGAYGLVNETVALIIYVVVFNVGIRWILNRLNARFEKQKKYWQSNFIQALSTPLAYYIWFSASIHFGNIIFQNFKHTCDPFNKMHVALSIGAVLAIAWFFMRWKRNTINQIVTKNKTHSILFDRGKIDALDKLASVSIFF